MSFLIYGGAALAEIGGCFAFWAWLRLGKSAWWALPGAASLAVFALLLTRVESDLAGRAMRPMAGSISPPRSPGCGRWSARRPTGGTWPGRRSA